MRILISTIVGFLVIAALVCAKSVTEIDSRDVGITSTFGNIDLDQIPLNSGLHFVSPWKYVIHVSTVQQSIEIDSTKIGTSIDKDKVPMTVDATISYSINPIVAPKIIKYFGEDYEKSLLDRAAPSAVRDSVLDFSWSDAMTTKHDALAKEIHDKFKTVIVDNMVSKGISKSEAEVAFDIPEVKLQELLPPQRILDANAEYQAATVDLQRQGVLTQIASQEAKRREEEGKGISNMMNALPPNFKTTEIADVMRAVSMKTEADALMRAVEEDKIQMMVLPYGTSPAVK